MLLIPHLPDDLTHGILARLPRAVQARLRLTCRAWNTALHPYSGAVSALRRSLGISEIWTLVQIASENRWCFLDPLCRRCYPLPPPPPPITSFDCLTPLGTELSILAAIWFKDVQSDCYICHLDALTMQWQCFHAPCLPTFDTDRSAFSSVLLGSYVYVAGGRVPTEPHFIWSTSSTIGVRCMWRIHIGKSCTTRRWERLPDMHLERCYAKGFVLKGQLYMLGGHCKSRFESQDIRGGSAGEVWDPRSKKWTLVPELWPANVFDNVYYKPETFVVDEKLYTFKRSTKEIMLYEDASQEWVCVGYIPMDKGRLCAYIGAVGREIWVYQYGVAHNSILTTTIPPTSQPFSWKKFQFEFTDHFQVNVQV